jgi:hypothetical protein
MLGDANLSNAYLAGAILRVADLTATNLTRAYLGEVDFSGAYLGEADLSGADLHKAILRRVILRQTVFSFARIRSTIFGYVDLTEAIGLEDVEHLGPSTLGMDTLALSKGKIPEVFLRGCGLSDPDIEYAKLYTPDLTNKERSSILSRIYDLQASRAVQISPLFISYSHSDSDFVDRLGNRLAEQGIRYWRDIHEMKAGRIEKQIERAISQNPTVLLIISEHSLSSDWVEHEVRTARGLEKEMRRDVLCPVTLDDSWKSSRWPNRIMEQITEYNILDFSKWRDDSKFEDMFRRLIDGLELFYKG